MSVSYRLHCSRRASLLSAGTLVAVSFLPHLGCGSGRPTCVGVTGTVSYRGQPVEGAGVAFISKQGRSASGTTNEQGRFTLMSFSPGDALCRANTSSVSPRRFAIPKAKGIRLIPRKFGVARPLRLALEIAAQNCRQCQGTERLSLRSYRLRPLGSHREVPFKKGYGVKIESDRI